MYHRMHRIIEMSTTYIAWVKESRLYLITEKKKKFTDNLKEKSN